MKNSTLLAFVLDSVAHNNEVFSIQVSPVQVGNETWMHVQILEQSGRVASVYNWATERWDDLSACESSSTDAIAKIEAMINGRAPASGVALVFECLNDLDGGAR